MPARPVVVSRSDARALTRFRRVREQWLAFARAHSALGLLATILAGMATGEWMLLEAISRGSPHPPLLAIGCFLAAAGSLASYRMAGTVPAPQDRQAADRGTLRLLPLLGAVGLTVYVLQQLETLPVEAGYLHVTLAWLMAFVLYAAAVVPWRVPGERAVLRWRAWLVAHRWPAVAVCVIGLVAFVVRVWQLGSIPFVFSGDEAVLTLEAIHVMNGEIRSPFTTGWMGMPTASFFFHSVAIYALGPTVEAARLPWALVGVASVLAAFWLVSRLAGTTLGLLTAALVATYHYHVHYSRVAMNNIADPLFVGLALLALYYALDRKRTLYWVLLGGVSGAALYLYPGSRMTPILIAVIAGYLLLRERGAFWRQHWRGMLVAGGAFLVAAAPMIQYAVRFPADFNARINTIGIMQPGFLENEAAARGTTALGVLLEQFQRAALSFNFFADLSPHYGLPGPLLDPLFGALFLLGLGYTTLRVLGPRPDLRLLPVVAWWWTGMFLGGMLTETPPQSQRLITLSVPACFFVALAVYKLVVVARSAGVIRGRGSVAVMAAAAVIFAGISLKTYFLDFSPQRIAGTLHAEIATELMPILRDLGPGYDAHFAGAPAMFWDFPTLHYPDYPMPGADIVQPLTAPPPRDIVRPGRGAAFIFLPQRLAELDLVRATFPAGEVREVYSPAQRRVIVTLYSIPPTQDTSP